MGESIRWCTFDCYGTLIDWDAGVRASLQSILGPRLGGIDLEQFARRWEALQFGLIQGPYQRYRTILAESLRATLKEFGIPEAPDDAQRFVASMPTWQPFPDTRSCLEATHRHTKLAIISNVDDDILAQSVRLMGVTFDALITAEQAQSYKPSIKPFRLALERLGVQPGELLHVAFGFKYDIGPAQSLGFRTCWVNRHGEPRPAGATPDHEIRDLRGLGALVAAP